MRGMDKSLLHCCAVALLLHYVYTNALIENKLNFYLFLQDIKK